MARPHSRVKPRPLLVTGCGRSGSLYTATALTASGLRCTHERVFTGRDSDDRQMTAGNAESSWFAVPWMSTLRPDTLTVHQVRHPLRCIGSYIGMGFFDRQPRERPIWKHYVKRAVGAPPSGQLRIIRMVERFQPEVFAPYSPAQRGAVFWLRWNQWVEQQCQRLALDYRRVRLEDIGCGVITSLIEDVGVAPRSDAAVRLSDIQTDTNTRRSATSLSWADLGDHAADVRRLARRYGYND